MRFRIIGSCGDNSSNDGIIFFAQRIEEMLMFYTSHIYRVPVYNTYLLIEEYSRTIQLVKNKAINQAHLSLILEEFYSQLNSDIVIKHHFTQDEIDHYISHLKGNSDFEQEKLMHYLWHIMGEYPIWCKEEAKSIVKQPREKKKIERILRSLIPMLIGFGYNPKYIYRYCRKVFSSKNVDYDSAMDTFLDRFDWQERKYDVYFCVSKHVEIFQSILETRLRVSFKEDKYSCRLKKDNNELCVHLTVNALDSDDAIDVAYNQFNLFSRYYKFLGDRNEEWCGKKALVIDSDGRAYDRLFLLQRYSYSRDYDSRTLGTNSEHIITKLIENAEDDDFNKLNRIIKTHNLSLSSTDMGNGFLNLWSILEMIGVSHRDDSKIKEIMNAAIPILMKGYIANVFEELHDYLKANMDSHTYLSMMSYVSEVGDEEYKIACLVMLSKYADARKKLYSHLVQYPLIRSRISQLYTDFFSDKKKLITEYDRYEQRLRWHIQRLYRTRNGIVHSGQNPRNIKSLGEHLHAYVDDIVLEIVNRLIQDNSLASIDNVIINARIFMETTYRDYKKGGEFDEIDIKKLLNK